MFSDGRNQYFCPSIVVQPVERGSGQEPGAEREWVGHEEEVKLKFGL
jgi:hypothetical protein